MGRDGEAGSGAGIADEVEDFGVTVKRHGGPVFGDLENRRCSMGFHLEAPVG